MSLYVVLAIVIAALLLFPVIRGILRGTELFVLQAKDGKFELVRGRLPQALFGELDDVARRERLDGVRVKAFVEGGQPRLVASGPGAERAEQMLRNVLGRFRLPQIRTGKMRA